ncbi:MAG: DNA-processing protein DprA [Candidatus Paceibacterota bacterium]|jgi:DNA processing protein
MNKEESIKILKEDFHKYKLLVPLLEIHDTPKQLFFKAKNEDILNNFLNKTWENNEYKILTIVGSRKNSGYSKDVLKFLLKNLIGEKIVIVSGLALGIDSLAHKNAMENNFPTISIPGSGLNKNVLYPSANISLSQEILDSENILISEYEDDRKSELYFFPARNRIMAAISDAVLIVEAGEKSGTLITARLAMEYGKNVGVIPNNIFAEGAKGSNKLIQDGAQIILNENDILEILKISKDDQGLLSLDFNNKKHTDKLKNILDGLSDVEQEILEKIIQAGSVEKDRLLAEMENDLEINYTDSLVALMSLEIKGFIKEELGEIRIVK